MFGHDWQPGEATIVDVRTKSTSGDGMVSVHEFVADVCVTGEDPFRTVMQEPTIATDFWTPSIGQVVRVHADAKRRKAKFDKSDPRVSAKAQLAANDARFDASATAPPLPFVDQAQVDAPAQTPEQVADPATRLRELTKLKDAGLLTDAEYGAKRQLIIDEL